MHSRCVPQPVTAFAGRSRAHALRELALARKRKACSAFAAVGGAELHALRSAHSGASLPLEHAEEQRCRDSKRTPCLSSKRHGSWCKSAQSRGRRTKTTESPSSTRAPHAVHSGAVNRQRESLWYTKVLARTPSRLTGRSSRPAAARHRRPAGASSYIVAGGPGVPRLHGRLSSNVRQQPKYRVCLPSCLPSLGPASSGQRAR